MLLGVLRLESGSSMWRMLYRQVCGQSRIYDVFPEHIIYVGRRLDFISHSRIDSPNGASPPFLVALDVHSYRNMHRSSFG
jgi:hypothetical protein